MIDIITTIRVLYLGDSPEEFELRALDDEGNQNKSILINTGKVNQYQSILDMINIITTTRMLWWGFAVCI